MSKCDNEHLNNLRLKGVNALLIFYPKFDTAKQYENRVYEITKNQVDFESEYKRGIFQCITQFECVASPPQAEKIKIGWDHDCYSKFKALIKEQDDFLIKPFEVEEGVLECKCGSRRVLSYSKQCRSSDEPMTTFATCMKCKSSWSYSG
jgi:DNA-directed RNA polymerase subunit M/transcription elongation factor TFIIS